jgi:hypothetical protein
MRTLYAVVLAAIITLAAVVAWGADLQWDYPSDWNEIQGYTVYFNEIGETDAPYVKGVLKTDPALIEDGTAVTYQAIDDKLNLAFGQEYTFHITAYNDDGQSDPSNYVTYTRVGYDPPRTNSPRRLLALHYHLAD